MIKINVTPSQLAAALSFTTSNSAGALVVLQGGNISQFANYGTNGEYVLYVLSSSITPVELATAGIPENVQWPVQSISG